MNEKKQLDPSGNVEVDGIEINYWIIKNLVYYGDSNIPFILVSKYGVEKLEELLTKACRRKVYVHTAMTRNSMTRQAVATIATKKRRKRDKKRY